MLPTVTFSKLGSGFSRRWSANGVWLEVKPLTDAPLSIVVGGEESDEFRKQMRELIGEVERELEADERSADSAEDRLDEFEENILENFEKYGIDGDAYIK